MSAWRCAFHSRQQIVTLLPSYCARMEFPSDAPYPVYPPRNGRPAQTLGRGARWARVADEPERRTRRAGALQRQHGGAVAREAHHCANVSNPRRAWRERPVSQSWRPATRTRCWCWALTAGRCIWPRPWGRPRYRSMGRPTPRNSAPGGPLRATLSSPQTLAAGPAAYWTGARMKWPGIPVCTTSASARLWRRRKPSVPLRLSPRCR